MGYRVWLVIVGAFLVVLGAGCDSSSPPADEPARAHSGSGDPMDAAMQDAPEVGTCWQMPPKKVVDPDYYFDDSPQVPCTEPHTTQTAAVLALDEPTVAAAKDYADVCWQYVHDYLGISLDSWVPWAAGIALPSREQVAQGASWLRCEVLFSRNWGEEFAPVAVLTTSAENVVTKNDDEVWVCLADDPDIVPQPFVSCRKPHQYESTGKLALIPGVQSYPSPQTRRREAAQCDDLTPEQKSRSTDTTVRWPRKEEFAPGGFEGACFMHRQDGTMLPPRP